MNWRRWVYEAPRVVLRRTARQGNEVAGALYLRLNGIETAGPVHLSGWPYIHNRGRITLGPEVTINSGVTANPVGGSVRTSIVVRQGATLTIGARTGVSNAEIYCATGIRIGERVLVGGGARIYDTDFHAIDPAIRDGISTTGARSKPVSIGDDVFIGGFSIILKGVTVGARSIIGAGSVVTRDIPPDEIWGGNPAVRVR